MGSGDVPVSLDGQRGGVVMGDISDYVPVSQEKDTDWVNLKVIDLSRIFWSIDNLVEKCCLNKRNFDIKTINSLGSDTKINRKGFMNKQEKAFKVFFSW